MRPPISPKPEWRALLDEMVVVATKEYRSIVFQKPRLFPPCKSFISFIIRLGEILTIKINLDMIIMIDLFSYSYSIQATPETEYGRMNIGSRPSVRKPSGDAESLRATGGTESLSCEWQGSYGAVSKSGKNVRCIR